MIHQDSKLDDIVPFTQWASHQTLDYVEAHYDAFRSLSPNPEAFDLVLKLSRKQIEDPFGEISGDELAMLAKAAEEVEIGAEEASINQASGELMQKCMQKLCDGSSLEHVKAYFTIRFAELASKFLTDKGAI